MFTKRRLIHNLVVSPQRDKAGLFFPLSEKTQKRDPHTNTRETRSGHAPVARHALRNAMPMGLLVGGRRSAASTFGENAPHMQIGLLNYPFLSSFW